MSGRLEFPRKVKDAAWLRASGGNLSVGKCEKCAAVVTPAKVQFDHILPDALKGKPDLANCMVLCLPCHKEKSGGDIRRVRKADRQRAAHIGATPAASRPIQSAGFPPTGKRREPKASLPRRNPWTGEIYR